MKKFLSSRLLIETLELSDSQFILKLLNTDGWIKFIGQRNVFDKESAKAYINKINNNPDIIYWTIKLQDRTPVGLVTLIKRDYLDHHDIGFAFLPEHSGKGYAFEAASLLLDHFRNELEHKEIVAVSLRNNYSSIKLLEKLGLTLRSEFEREGEDLFLYGIKF